MTEIVKVQRPLASNSDMSVWLFYGAGRTKMEYYPEIFIPERVKLAMGQDFKAYFKATYHPTHGWLLMERVADQPW